MVEVLDNCAHQLSLFEARADISCFLTFWGCLLASSELFVKIGGWWKSLRSQQSQWNSDPQYAWRHEAQSRAKAKATYATFILQIYMDILDVISLLTHFSNLLFFSLWFRWCTTCRVWPTTLHKAGKERSERLMLILSISWNRAWWPGCSAGFSVLKNN